jgi:hypothetical protein
MKYPAVTELARVGSSYYGNVSDGGVGVAFRIEIGQGRNAVPKVSTGKAALKLRPNQTQVAIESNAERDRILKRVLVKNTKVTAEGDQEVRITVFVVKGGVFFVVSQLRCKSGWSRRLSVQDPLIGHWLMVGRIKPAYAKLQWSREHPEVDCLKYLVVAADAARKSQRSRNPAVLGYYSKMTLEEAMEDIILM